MRGARPLRPALPRAPSMRGDVVAALAQRKDGHFDARVDVYPRRDPAAAPIAARADTSRHARAAPPAPGRLGACESCLGGC